MKKFSLVSFLILMLSACGGGGSSSGGNVVTPVSNKIQLIPNQSYVVAKGDQFVKDEAETVLRVTHTADTNLIQVELVSGSGHIIKKT